MPLDDESTTPQDEQLAFTVASVWRAERVSCPHPDILRVWLAGSLPAGAADFVTFHLDESDCPYCSAIVAELREGHARAAEPQLEDLRHKLLRSTIGALREPRA